jgi:hypothetical protein
MSRNSRWLELQRKICELDARYDGKKSFTPTSFCSAASRWREHRHPYLCEIYRTGAVPRRAVESLAARKRIPVPDELLAMPSPHIEQSVAIPDDVLFPKPKRGRPRNDALRRQANDLQCSLRHARRLVANGKLRQRSRERQPDDVIEALQARQKRADLVREMEEETVVSYLSFAISYVRNKGYTVHPYSEVDCRLARRWVKNQGMVAPVLMISAVMRAKSFRIARKLLGMSRATLYRKYGSQLDDLSRRAKELLALAVVDWKKMANMKLPKRKRNVVTRPDSAWEELEQTLFYQH